MFLLLQDHRCEHAKHVTALRSGREIPKPHQSLPSGDVEEEGEHEQENEELEDEQHQEEEKSYAKIHHIQKG